MKKNVLTSKLCAECRGLGSVPDPQQKGSFIRCAACGGTGLATPAPEPAPAPKDKE